MAVNQRAVARASLLGFAVVVGMTVLFATRLSTAQPRVLTLKTFDNFFEPEDIVLKTGDVTIVVSNEGKGFHNFFLHAPGDKYLGAIPGAGGQYVAPGKSAEKTFDLDEPGEYLFYCGATPGIRHDRTDRRGEIVRRRAVCRGKGG